MQNKVFVSYSRSDSLFVKKVSADLKNLGINIWLDQLDIPLGSVWDLEVEKAVNECSAVLFFASVSSVVSNNALNEVYTALEDNKRVIPIRIDNCNIPFRLKRLQHYDLTENYEEGLMVLSKALRSKMDELQDEPSIELNDEITKHVIEQINNDDNNKLEEQNAKNLNKPELMDPRIEENKTWSKKQKEVSKNHEKQPISEVGTTFFDKINTPNKRHIIFEKISNASILIKLISSFVLIILLWIVLKPVFTRSSGGTDDDSRPNYADSSAYAPDTTKINEDLSKVASDYYYRGESYYENKDYGAAFVEFQKSAEAGNSDGMCGLSILYADGLGVSRDYNKAFYWAQKSADAGNDMGVNNLGTFYYEGLGVKQDFQKAYDYFVIAANAGNTLAMGNLAMMYRNGDGVERNDELANEWLAKANGKVLK